MGQAHGPGHGPGPARAQAKHVFLAYDINKKDAQRPYDPFAGGIAPRSLLCVRKRRFSFLTVGPLFATIRHYSTLFATIRNYSQLFATIRHYSPLFDTIRHYSTLFATIRHYSQLFDTIRHYSPLFATTIPNYMPLYGSPMSKITPHEIASNWEANHIEFKFMDMPKASVNCPAY